MKRRSCHKIFLFLSFLTIAVISKAQKTGDILKGITNKFPGNGGQSSGTGGDSLHNRSRYEDSITVIIYYADSSGAHKLDSSIDDFTKRFPIPATNIYLGNTGVATRSILFDPLMKIGFDPGFHALDVYKWQLEKSRFFNVTRPYTELAYQLASRAEQIIEVMHTQNIRPNWNFSFNYRLINAPGVFRNQKTNHNNYLFTSWYQAPSKRYNNYLVLLGNKLQSGESGGIKSDKDYLNDIIYAKDRFLIPTNIGGSPDYGTDFFSTALSTGNRYKEFNFLLRQQYDLGRKDSLVTDSTVTPLFYPKLRFEHSLNYGTYQYTFKDLASSSNQPDSAFYSAHYRVTPLARGGQFLFRDEWKEFTNDFSVYQFPDTKNLNQYIKLGAEFQVMNGKTQNYFTTRNIAFVNTMAHAEYRNRTRNQKWDILAFGKLFLSGYNPGDYHAYVSLQRIISPKLGSLLVGFENLNRKSSFIYDQRSAFYLDDPKKFSTENTLHFFSEVILPKIDVRLKGDYYLLTNYLYLSNYYQLKQESTLFNVLRISALKTFHFGKHWNLHAEIYVQQKTGNAELHFPLVYTRNRFAYEGDLGFKKLNIAMGLEARYHTPYKADNYSPLNGQFFYQDSVTINNLPEIAGFIHFRIRSFKAFFRLENLNTARLFGGFQFNNNNLAAPGYPMPGLIMRFGIYWSFVN